MDTDVVLGWAGLLLTIVEHGELSLTYFDCSTADRGCGGAARDPDGNAGGAGTVLLGSIHCSLP
jgi:hypothetical protein